MTTRSKLTALLVLGATAAAAVLAVAPVFAHARYKSSTPGKGEVLAASPARVEIIFTQQVQKVSGGYGIEVAKDQGATVTTGPAVVDETDRSKLSVPLQAGLQPGRYVVNWKNVSDADGDPATGAFSFYVTTQPNTADLESDKQLELIGAEPETPAAGETQSATSSAVSTPAAAPSTAAPPAATATRAPGISAATPGPTPASASSDGGSNTGLYVIIAAAVIAGIIAGFGAWRYLARRGQ